MKQVFATVFSLSILAAAMVFSFSPGIAWGQTTDGVSSIADCETLRANITKGCLERNNQANPTREQVATCSVTAQKEYDLCAQGLPSDADSKEKEFEVPSAESLNQFYGLSAQQVIGNFIRIATGLMGSIAFAIMVFAGVMWMTAGGNSDRQHKSMSMMVWASLGIIIILSSYTIARFLLDAYTN